MRVGKAVLDAMEEDSILEHVQDVPPRDYPSLSLFLSLSLALSFALARSLSL